jgi:membrane associated rhomboid family serine protease
MAELRSQVQILGGFVLLIWITEIVDQLFFRGSLDRFGIYPRSIESLPHILFAPFLHGGYYHVAANTVPFLVLGWLVMLRNRSEFWLVSIITALASGLGTWVLGRSAYHIGASGMIFGYFGYLLLRGYFERSLTAIVIALLVGVCYGGMIFGILPTRSWVSWEGHLFGFLGGVLCARLLSADPQDSNM